MSNLTSQDIAAIAAAIRPGNPIEPHKIIYGVGASAVAAVVLWFGSMTLSHDERLDRLTAATERIVTLQEGDQKELTERGVWMGGINSFRENTRIRLDRIERELAGETGVEAPDVQSE
ncbi:hypothetical protein QQS45_08465 [Alteriqipengyuania flavescens]|uniref:hypothetical protein n=1 Tax=Alteriqipengyuania flavescens TaxID=3053610 RepID=UPI0025B5A9DA|nr:hypothetical protein [Alteriqipengyuania flavescens]WJY17680.1 hypothetical protein QQW98_08460 [Alteriqipengyuania flavescens]WJY23623.1 hypothetical protein QQS45_08465 [Alteriqipengyuania flavescens]